MENRGEEQECSEPKKYRLVEGCLVACRVGESAVVPEIILDRRQRGRFGYEYQVQWRGLQKEKTWVTAHKLSSMGHSGMVKREDERQAAQRALNCRPLTTPAVEAHLAGFGLDSSTSSHRRMKALSHGQRARVVLAAATWLAPHLLVLDEPTNYLDNTALAALHAGLNKFRGGVVISSHNAALLQEVCTERWTMQDGQLCCQDVRSSGAELNAERVVRPPVKDAAVAAAAAAAKEKKRQRRLREFKRKNGEAVSDSDTEWWEDLLKKTGSRAAHG